MWGRCFQSAAGVASLGRVRDALLAEAEQIWAPRKSNSRSYYAAQERLDQASAQVKQASVRTRVWADASSKVEALRADLDAARAQLTQLQVGRSRLERVRRLAPLLRAWRDHDAELTALGAVAELPADAAAGLVAAEREHAVAAKSLELRLAEVERAETELAALKVDAALLALATEIEALEQMRVEYGPYAQQIVQRLREIAALWQGVGTACAQLDWPCDHEQAVVARLPKLLVRRELGRLARDFSGLEQGVRAAQANEAGKRTEIESLEAAPPAIPQPAPARWHCEWLRKSDRIWRRQKSGYGFCRLGAGSRAGAARRSEPLTRRRGDKLNHGCKRGIFALTAMLTSFFRRRLVSNLHRR